MADYFSTDPGVVARRLRAAFDGARDGSGRLLFPDHDSPGTPGYNLRSLLTQEVVQWHREANEAYKTMSPQTAAGLYLNRWAEFFGTPRGGIRYATGDVALVAQTTGDNLLRLFGADTVGEGALVTAPDGSRFRTLAPAQFPADGRRVTVPVQAERPGPGASAAAGAALSVEAGALTPAVTATAASDVAGGTAEETDAQLRFRLVRALIDPTTFEGFRVALLSHPDVSDVVMHNAAYGPGTVEGFVVPALALPRRGLRAELEGVWAGGGGSAYVSFPDYEGVQLRVRVGENVPADAAARIADYVNNLPLGDRLVMNAVEALVQSSGDGQVLAARRGTVDPDGDLVDAAPVRSVTNLTPRTPRSKWHTRPEWITICQ